MITSRKLEDLLPPVAERAEKLLAVCADAGIELLVTSTYRDFEAQDRLYAQGRFVPGQIVTWAKAGDSWHNWKRAFDVVPIRNGKLVWSTRGLDGELWKKVGKIGESLGLEWGGSWERHPDYPHFQDKMGRTLYGLKKEAGLIK
jgi:peptidoglycan LD-endopeptidase CwlK